MRNAMDFYSVSIAVSLFQAIFKFFFIYCSVSRVTVSSSSSSTTVGSMPVGV